MNVRCWGAAVLLLVGLALPAGKALADPQLPPRTGSIVDLANLLEPFQEQPLATQFATLKARTGVDFVVVTLPSLHGYSIETWGRLLGNSWGVGGKSGLGAVLIVAPNDREVRIEVGDALSVMFPDSAASSIIDREILPKFRQGRLSSGILAGANAMIFQATKPSQAVERSAPAKPSTSGRNVERSGSYDRDWLRDHLPSQGHILFGIFALFLLFVLYKIKAWRILDVSGDGAYPGAVERQDSSWGWFWNTPYRYDRGTVGAGVPRARSSPESSAPSRSSGFSISWGSGAFRGSGSSRSFGGSSIGRSSGGGFSGRGASGRW